MQVADLPFKLLVLDAAGAAKRAAPKEFEAAAASRFYWSAAPLKVLVNRELRSPKDGGSTAHVELDAPAAKMTYVTADNLAVLPENDAATVACVAKALGVERGALFALEPVEKGWKQPFPTPCAVGDALARYCDLGSAPRRALLKELAPLAGDAAEAAELAKLAAKDGRDAYRTRVEDAQLSLAELICDEFPSLTRGGGGKLDLARFFSLAPRLQPRYYTIASSSDAHGGNVHLTVSVTSTGARQPTAEGGAPRAPLVGVCSSFLAQLPPAGGSCRAFVRASSFRLPEVRSKPVLLIGPGTGIAPMRALLHEVHYS